MTPEMRESGESIWRVGIKFNNTTLQHHNQFMSFWDRKQSENVFFPHQHPTIMGENCYLPPFVRATEYVHEKHLKKALSTGSLWVHFFEFNPLTSHRRNYQISRGHQSKILWQKAWFSCWIFAHAQHPVWHLKKSSYRWSRSGVASKIRFNPEETLSDRQELTLKVDK